MSAGTELLSAVSLQKLETILPPRAKVEIPQGDHVDEVSMVDYETTKGSSKTSPHAGGPGAGFFRDAFGGGADDDDDDDGVPGGQRVECNTH